MDPCPGLSHVHRWTGAEHLAQSEPATVASLKLQGIIFLSFSSSCDSPSQQAACAVLAYFVAAVSPNMDVANSALPAYVVSLLFFVGLLIRHEDQPDYWSWCGP